MKRTLLNLKIALGSLGNFKLRTALAVLGVFFGTFSLDRRREPLRFPRAEDGTGDREPREQPRSLS